MKLNSIIIQCISIVRNFNNEFVFKASQGTALCFVPFKTFSPKKNRFKEVDQGWNVVSPQNELRWFINVVIVLLA